MKIGKRPKLLIFYYILSSTIIWLVSASDLGSMVFGLLTSWSAIPLSGLGAGAGFVLAAYFLYLFLLVLINSLYKRAHGWKHPYVSLSFHIIGSIVAFFVEDIPLSHSLVHNILGLIIGFPPVVLFLEQDWRFAGSSPKNPG